ncbi:MAG: hypothetical protein LUB56_01360 [Coprobacillus sp.]|nr:hypothetical protein [Coprobacillus sp.]
MTKEKRLLPNIITSFFVLLCAGCSLEGAETNTSTPKESSNVIMTSVKEAYHKDSPSDFSLYFPGWETATEVDAEQLSCRISTSTSTPTSQSYTATFATEIPYYFSNRSSQKYIYIAINDNIDIADLDPIENEEERPIYIGYAFEIIKGQADIVIPYRMTHGTRAIISVESIGSHLVDDDAVSGLNSIYIPSTITEIDEDAFINLENSGVEFILGFDDASQVEFDLSVFPDGTTITWAGYASGDVSYSVGNSDSADKKTNFFLGSEETYDGDYEDDLRIGLQYDVYYEGEYLETRIEYFPVTSSNRSFDGIGKSLGQTNLVLYFDIELSDNETINADSLIFFNIYNATRGETSYYPDLEFPVTDADGNVTGTVGQLYTIPTLSYTVEDDISNYIEYSFGSLNKFSGYSTFVMNVKKADVEIYDELNHATYVQNIPYLEDGTLKLRYRLTSLNSMYYRITYLDSNDELVTVDKRVETPVSYTEFTTKKETSLAFIIKDKDIANDFSIDRARKIELVGVRITIDLFNQSRNAIVTKSSIETRFGIVNAMDLVTESPGVTNYSLIVGLVAVGYVVVFLAITIGLYFYLKNKYKNDEFRRMNTRHFINQAILAFIWIGSLLFFTVFTLIRVFPFNNAIVTFNPTDPYVFVFAILSIIAIGYYIRYFWLAGKAARHRKEVERLKLNEDEDDDGTGTEQIG